MENDILSDEEMAALEASHAKPKRAPSDESPDVLSDEEMAKMEARQPSQSPAQEPMGWGEYLGRGATGAVPYVAGAAAGAAGTPLGLGGTLGGGTLGYMGGKEIERILNHYLFDDKVQEKPMEALSRVAGNAKEGVLQEMLGMGMGKAIESAAPIAKNMAQKYAVRHLRPTPQVARTLGPKRLKDIGQEALDSGATKFGGKVEGTAQRLADRMDESGSLIGDMVENSKGTANPLAIAERFDKEVINPLRDTSGNESLISKLEGQRDSFLEKYAPEESLKRKILKEHPEAKLNAETKPMSAHQVEKQKRIEDDRVNWLTDPKLNSKAQMGWAGVLRDEGEKAVDDLAFPHAKRAYGNQALAKSMAERTNALTDGGTGLFGHMSDLGVNLEALSLLAHGNPAGLAMAGARGITKGRTTSSLAKLLDEIRKGASSSTVQQGGNFLSRPIWNRMLDKQ